MKLGNTSSQEANVIIDRLGGTGAVAKIFGLEAPSVSHWRKAGIPGARVMYLRLAYPALFDENGSVAIKP